ncbi:MAG TPA: transporter substrate-binding domain-containing protein [Anaerolineales bacterium]|nr:transporter substrate-binding domain-containing protein [Anaerolineales bacterium]
MRKTSLILSALIIASFILGACGGGPTAAADKLEEVKARGTLIVATDPAYPPQSELVENATRAANTKCASDQVTGDELRGFDIDTAKEIAKRLGVEACFVTPDWTLITGGSWADRWDISVGSMTPDSDRLTKLYFSQPYYTTPAAFFVHNTNTSFSQPSDLSGQTIGACTGCTYDKYLGQNLEIPGVTFNFVVQNPDFKGYDTDTSALQDLAIGDGERLDAVLTAQPTGEGVIADGMPLKQLGDPVFYEYLAAAFDKASSSDSVPLAKEVSRIIAEMHADGTLLKFSQEHYGIDYTSAAATFDLSAFKQW